MNLNIIDRGVSTWFVNIGAYRLPHPLRPGVIFESGQKYQINPDAWIDAQETLKVTDPDQDHEDEQLYPKEPGSPQFDAEADRLAAEEAAKKFAAGEEERKRVEAERAERELQGAQEAAEKAAEKAAAEKAAKDEAKTAKK